MKRERVKARLSTAGVAKGEDPRTGTTVAAIKQAVLETFNPRTRSHDGNVRMGITTLKALTKSRNSRNVYFSSSAFSPHFSRDVLVLSRPIVKPCWKVHHSMLKPKSNGPRSNLQVPLNDDIDEQKIVF